MAQAPKKVAVIGFDCALPHLVEKHISEGHLPNFKRVIDGGTIADNCLVPFPTVTPPNWATIATGAWAGTHGITDFHYHEPGTPLPHVFESFSSERWLAEPLWDTADRAGKKCIVLNYPGAWPSHMQNGIMVGGSGLTVGELRDGHRGLEADNLMCADQLITTGTYPMCHQSEFVPATGWANLNEPGEEPLEIAAELSFHRGAKPIEKTTWYVLARQSDSSNDGYDTITLSPAKDLQRAFCTLKVGEWSPKISTKLKLKDGSEQEVFFRAKLIELSDDAEEFRLYLTGMIATEGWSNPPQIAKEIVSDEGVPNPGGGLLGLPIGWIDLDTYAEIGAIHDKWLGDAAATLLQNHEWDVFFMHSHPPDWLYHALITEMDEKTCKDRASMEKAWDVHLKIYQSQDRMLGQILEAIGKDTLIFLVSDHGATPDGPNFNPYDILIPAGLAAVTGEVVDKEVREAAKIIRERKQKIDHAKSRAIPQREIYVYVNLKGRDPAGIVDPADYEKVQQEIIDAFYAYVDPTTGKRPVALALTKKDARLLGLAGDRVGDVVYALYPWFGAQHGQILPTGEYGVGSLKGFFVVNGTGIKKAFRLQRTCGLQDIVPTICYVMDLPVPEKAEGAILYQVFKDPNFKQKEIQKLRDGLARMETALARQEREPWDKHDCA